MPHLTVRRATVSLLFICLTGVAFLWFARLPIADATIRRAIATRGVRASYTVKKVGLRWERIENVSIGDPRSPDLTADWAEIRVSAGFGGLGFKAIRAGGVRLRGRIIDGRLDFGELDKLLPKPDRRVPFVLPDLNVDLHDVRIRIASLWGNLGMRIDGTGNLENGFVGKIAAIAPSFGQPGCLASPVTAYLDVAVRDRAPSFKGPVRAGSVLCKGLAAAKPAVRVDVALNAGFDQWRGSVVTDLQGIQYARTILAATTGRISFQGTAAATRGTVDLSIAAGSVQTARFLNANVLGQFALSDGLSGQGKLRIGRLLPDASFAKSFELASRNMTGTLVGPLIVQVADSVQRAASGIALTADAGFSAGQVTISNFAAASMSGAFLRATGGTGIRVGRSGFTADTHLAFGGGGFPAVQAVLQRRADGKIFGLAQVAPFSGGNAKIALERVRFAANPSGAMRFETVAMLDGPLNGGRVEDLRLPLNVTITSDGTTIINNGCTPVAFRTLSMSGLQLSPASILLCPVRAGSLVRLDHGEITGGANISAPRLIGRVGGTVLDLRAGNARVSLGTRGFVLNDLSARLGSGNRISRLAIASLTGQFANGVIRGRFGGASGKIANVPLLVDADRGDWILRNGSLGLRASVRVSDEISPARFNSLISDDVTLTVADGRIATNATLRSPGSKADVAEVKIAHDLKAGRGSAMLSVDELRFGKTLQPEEITRLTLGVIANVDGAISGTGIINWSPDSVTSHGHFQTEKLDFAAAFGPVTGLKGEVNFDDLLALTTLPRQHVNVASINPGTLVTNGVISYQLLPEQRVAVESGVWPFAGGDLLLDPTVIDMGREVELKLTFRVVGLDAARFIQQLEFENLAATGTFDGIMPMYFDANGGRVEGGRLVVRRGGGTLAYVGEISNTAMNIYAKLAFDALKSIRYQNLTIALDGPLDGEIVSLINFNGVNEAPLSPPKSYIARQFIGLPFLFNIKVKAPFRSLLNTARTFQDPSSLLQRTVPELGKSPVQPSDSDAKQ